MDARAVHALLDHPSTRIDRIPRVLGSDPRADILSAVPARIQVMLDEIPVGAAHGDQGMVNLMADGEPGRSQRAPEDLRQRTPTIAAELS